MDARWLRWKNAKALWVAIEQSEREASAKAKARRHIEEREALLRRLAGGHMELLDDSDDRSSYTEGQSSTTDCKRMGR